MKAGCSIDTMDSSLADRDTEIYHALGKVVQDKIVKDMSGGQEYGEATFDASVALLLFAIRGFFAAGGIAMDVDDMKQFHDEVYQLIRKKCIKLAEEQKD
jgi:hypothetical protein